MPDPLSLIDLERYPIGDLDAPAAQALIEQLRKDLAERGVALLPGFLKPEAVEQIVALADRLKPDAHLEDVWGTPYLELPNEEQPEGHPRRSSVHSLTWVIAYDQIPRSSGLCALYHWDGFRDFIAEVLQRNPLHRMADPLGALNLTVMEDGHVQGWHYDNTDFVVSLAVQGSEGGGEFECAPHIRNERDERYPEVARVLRGEARDELEIYPMTPGTLMLFEGRHSLHRVSPVEGPVARKVALFAFDTRPDTDSKDLFKLVRYGRSEARTPPA